jgi:uncharacterized membrane protein YbhN (UPF0104 family)
MLINWSLEAMKWKMLIVPLERISFLSSLKSIFAGVTVSIFTPNRVGEFAGRVFYLNTDDKIKASLMSIVGSILQLLVTIVGGVTAYFILNRYSDNLWKFTFFISRTYLLIILVLLIAAILVVFYFKRNFFVNYKKYIEVFTSYSSGKIFSVFVLSVIRYAVFTTQFYLILKLFGIEAEPLILYALIAFSFFVISVVPTFAFTEIAVRGATAVYIFSYIKADPASVIAASLLLWTINLAFPALIGSFFVLKLKFFKG